MVVEWAVTAEASGWGWFFLWDHRFAFSNGPIEAVDPWVALTAAACATSTIRIGTLVTPLPRRRPVVVGRQTVTLDRLSRGRLTLGVGTGAFPYEWEYCGEEGDHRTRGAMLDEHLDLLDRLWTGHPVRHDGPHYRAAGPEWSATCYPSPLQHPRIPVWVGGSWPGSRPFVRAARWDGVVPMRADGPWQVADTAAVAVADRMRSLRADLSGLDIAVPGESDGGDLDRHRLHQAHADAGATWWVEAIHPARPDLSTEVPWPSAAMQRLAAGP